MFYNDQNHNAPSGHDIISTIFAFNIRSACRSDDVSVLVILICANYSLFIENEENHKDND